MKERDRAVHIESKHFQLKKDNFSYNYNFNINSEAVKNVVSMENKIS